MLRSDFCVFILTHGRPDRVFTYKKLQQHGYTGPVFIVVDNEDKTLPQYRERFGDRVLVFDKAEVAAKIDEGDNFGDRRAIIYARNVCFDLAERMGFRYFIELDDDYYWFGYRMLEGGRSTRKLDSVFSLLVDYMETCPAITSIALSQGGDHIGGFDEKKQISRKAMNSFICSTERRFQFFGRINEDVNTYVGLGSRGSVFFTVHCLQLDQKDTQSNAGGMSDLYRVSGTYVKSFYSVMYNPSSVRVAMMNTKHPRLHHLVNWNAAVPKIVAETVKKVPAQNRHT